MIYLYYYENMSAAAIGELIGKSEANVHKMLSRARGKLKKILIEGGVY